MKLRLRARSALVTGGGVALAVTLLSLLLTWQFNQSTDRIRELSTQALRDGLTEVLRAEASDAARGYARIGARALAVADRPSLELLSEQLLRDDNVLFVQWWSHSDGVVHSAGRASLDGGEPTLVTGLSSAVMASASGPVMRVDTPVVREMQPVGTLRAVFGLAPVEQQAAQLGGRLNGVIARGKKLNWTHVATAGGISLVCALGLGTLVARQLVLPIRRLADYAAAVGLGQHAAPLPVERSDELGDLARSLREMSQNLQETTGEVHYLAYHDSLTQLPNRAQLKQSLRQAIGRAGREHLSVALLFIDLDDFKRVNDTLGHEAGDALLKDVAVRLRACLREGDDMNGELAPPGDNIEPRETIARLGGDEFTVVLNGVRESEDTSVVARRILDALREPFVLAGQEVVVGASIGITTYPEDGNDVDTLLRNADVAMYQAKSRGKNLFEFYNDSMHRMATERLSLETDLRHAIDYDQMRVLYQPIVDVQTDDLVGVDAQVRWLHPALGTVLPNVFLPLAEQSGFIVELDRWLIDQVCADLATLHALGHRNVDLAASLGSVHFREHSVAELVVAALNRHDVRPSRLALAIRERTLMRNARSATEFLQSLRSHGVHAWVDDFGSGHSPLRVLPRLAVDGLRINSSDLTEQSSEHDVRAIVGTLVAMAHSLKLKVSATGVETTEQLQMLRDVGCDYAQGSLIVRPMLLADLAAWMDRQNATVSARTGTFAAVPLPVPGIKK